MPPAALPSITAILAAHNEEDIVGQVVSHLLSQGVRVYFIDHESTDATLAEVERLRHPGIVGIERFVAPPDPDGRSRREKFAWAAILARKQEVARELTSDWFIHQDADEFRESPWPRLSLQEAVALVDAGGWNAVDFDVLNFWPTPGGEAKPRDDVREVLRYYAPGAAVDRLQVRCWKQPAEPVDLVSSGGHEVVFPGRRIFPVRFLLRHYPIRSEAHGRQKVLRERRARMLAEERLRGWHVQYDECVRTGGTFLRAPEDLVPYDGDAVRLRLLLEHRTVEDLEQRIQAAESERAQLADRLVALARSEAALRDENLRLAHPNRPAPLTAAFDQEADRLRTFAERLERDVRDLLASRVEQERAFQHASSEVQRILQGAREHRPPGDR